ncbi:hypothetical protein LHGZ1_2223 [Laribacter hongkongensis]|uniref:Uncharacterized protein n=1 Tax=Laribacter hongkongensis TaxID=168471 RepID=A0A248LKR8_9NEIS|nr:hypothetical protein LHGZ1_2223 [Laribacter hongkongensis]
MQGFFPVLVSGWRGIHMVSLPDVFPGLAYPFAFPAIHTRETCV